MSRGKDPSKLTIHKLWVKSAGHCQFEGCNEALFIDGVTLKELNKANGAWMLITYLTLRRQAVPTRNIAATLWPDKDPEATTGSIRGIIYRFRKKFALTEDIQILRSSDFGYELNPDMTFTCDVWEMDELCEKAQHTDDKN